MIDSFIIFIQFQNQNLNESFSQVTKVSWDMSSEDFNELDVMNQTTGKCLVTKEFHVRVLQKADTF